MQFRHAVRRRPLEPDHGDKVTVQLSGFERRLKRALCLERDRGRFQNAIGGLHCGDLADAPAQRTAHQAQAAIL